MGSYAEIGSFVLLYFLVFGMSATVDIRQARKQLRNRNALLTGITLQFIILPFLGFVVVKVLNLDAPMGITLLVVTSSPGGSYSNWWCSLFNAELALSVTMTTISTLLSIIMLPVNLILYATTTYSNDVVKSLDWTALFVSLLVVIGGISSGLICSATVKSPHFSLLMNKLGNFAGIALVFFSIFVSSGNSSGSDVNVWSQPAVFYIGVATPCLLGLLIATWMASHFQLAKPERVAVAVECCYQNTGIATSVAAAIFEGDELAVAVGVPLFYGICEAVFLAIYCVVCWKLGWTKAPADAPFCTVITTSYEVKEWMQEDTESIEVVLGSADLSSSSNNNNDAPTDLIFSTTKEGYQIDEVSLESLSQHAADADARSLSTDGAEFTIDDLDDGDGGEHGKTVEVEMDAGLVVGATTPSRRRARTYDSVEVRSPDEEKKMAAASSSIPQSAELPPTSMSKPNPVKHALSSLRNTARGNKKYAKALAVHDDDEDTVPLPVEGKQID